MNYFIEGLQGSGKSTLMDRLSGKYPEYHVYREGDYSPVELAWCAYVDEKQDSIIRNRYSKLRQEIEAKSFKEGDHTVICYTKIRTDISGFYQDLEQHEIYNGRLPLDRFRQIIFDRYQRWNGNREIFECSLFQNIVEEMMLFRNASNEMILSFYKDLGKILEDKDLHILYLKTDDIPTNIGVIRKERSDDAGRELWFPLMLKYFDESPHAVQNGLSGETELYRHFARRQELELRICRELFPDCHTILSSKSYEEDDICIE